MSGESAIVFPCDGEELLGILHNVEATNPRTAVVIVVGGPQYRVGSHRQFVLLARELADHGYPVLRFDYRGMGDSSGAQRNFEAVHEDIAAACDALFRCVPTVSRIVLFGLCDAASAALMYSISDPRVQGLILANPWVRTDQGAAKAYIEHYYAGRLLSAAFWRKMLSGQVNLGGSLASFLSNLRASRSTSESDEPAPGSFVDAMRRALERFDGDVLFVISGKDLTAKEFLATCESSVPWAKAMAKPKVFMRTLEAADHTFSTDAALETCNREIRDWLGRHFADREVRSGA